jgi:hypothetical protein
MSVLNTYGSSVSYTSAEFSGYPAPTVTTKFLSCTKALTVSLKAVPSTCKVVFTGQTYSVTGSDVGKYLAVAQVATNSKGSATSISASSAKIETPTNTGPVSVSPAVVAKAGIKTNGGSVTNGDTLTATSGKWDGYPLPAKSFSAWFRCETPITETQFTEPADCSAIPGTLNKKTYKTTSSDLGRYVTIEEVAVNSYGTINSWSPTTAQVTGKPTIARATNLFSAAYPNNVSFSNATFSGFPVPTVTTKFLSCSKAISTALNAVPSTCKVVFSGENYSVTGSDVGRYLAIAQVAVNSKGSATSVSKTSGKIAAPINALPISISASLVGKSGVAIYGGSATVGDNLIASPGKWDGYPLPTKSFSSWFRCESPITETQLTKPADCSVIPNTLNKKIYAVTNEDVGLFLTIEEIGLNKYGSVTAWSPTTAQVTGQPSAISPPSLVAAGAPVAGTLISAVAGVWGGFPDPTVTFQWYRCDAPIQTQSRVPSGCTSIQTANSQNYTPTSDDGGKYLSLLVTASNTLKSVSVITASSGIVTQPPTATIFPSIAGIATAGETLTGNKGVWVGYPSPTFTYSWFRCSTPVLTVSTTRPGSCFEIADSTSTSYLLNETRAGEHISFFVTATDGVTTKTYWSTTTSAVTYAPAVAVAPYLYSGQDPSVGSSMSLRSGTWRGFPIPTFTYSWWRCETRVPSNGDRAGCTEIPNATNTYYTTTTADGGKFIQGVVSATNIIGTTTYSIGSTTMVTAPATVIDAPVVSGTPRVGETLSATAGTWSGFPTPRPEYSWYRCTAEKTSNWNVAYSGLQGCSPIPNATGLSYVVTAGDAGKYLSLFYNSTELNGAFLTKTTSIIATPPTSIVGQTVSVTGTRKYSSRLSISNGWWNGHPGITTSSLTYQWFRCSSPVSGRETIPSDCEAIEGATLKWYDQTLMDIGYYLTVKEMAQNTAGSAFYVAPSIATTQSSPVIARYARMNLTGAMSYPGSITYTPTEPFWAASPSITALHYQWYKCTDAAPAGGIYEYYLNAETLPWSTCTAIAGEVSNTYAIRSADAGYYLTLKYSATNTLGKTTYWTGRSDKVLKAPAIVTYPTLTNTTAQVGSSLYSTAAQWVVVSGTSFSKTHSYYRCDTLHSQGTTLANDCIQIAEPSEFFYFYTFTESDVGKYIIYGQSATNTVGTSNVYTATSPIVTP